MDHKNKVKLLSLSIAAIAVLALLIINGNKKEAGVLGGKQEDVNNNKTDAAVTALNTEDTPAESDASTKSEETNNKITVINKETKENINTLIKDYYGNINKLDKEVLAATKDQEAEKTVKSITEKREGIEEYNQVKTTIKAGLEEGTYLVFTTYNMKFFNIETEAPGMSVVFVVTDKSGALAIENDISDPKLQEYINELSQEEEIKSEIKRVDTELSDATKSDETLKNFIDKLREVSK